MSDYSIDILNNISFKNKTLYEWEKEFTLSIPSSYITNQEMQRNITHIINKYHLAYNCYNELALACNEINSEFNDMKTDVLKEIIKSYKENGITKMPGKDTLNEIALSSSNNLKKLNKKVMAYEIIKDFFENNKMKLEKTLPVLMNLSYLISSSDKVTTLSGVPTL